MSTTDIIAYTANDGTTQIIYPAPDMFDPDSPTRQLLASQDITFETDDDVYNWIKTKDVPQDATNITEIDQSLLPADRYFRDAWTVDGTSLTIDPVKALAIKIANLQAIATPLIDNLKSQFIDALMAADSAKQATITSQISQLNDIPNLTYPTDLNELQNYTPDIIVQLTS